MATKTPCSQPTPTEAEGQPSRSNVAGRFDEMIDALLGPPLREPASDTQRPDEDDPPR